MVFLYVMIVMVSVLSGGSAEVVSDFWKCKQFFVNDSSPTILPGHQYKKICQTLKGKVYYATLYDTNNKIPVYSAYVFNKQKCYKRSSSWFIEPQLDNPGAGLNMLPERSIGKSSKQAVSDDYRYSGYDRGHLSPVYLASSQDCADATFTLTNAAPQDISFNRGKWKALEEKTARELTEQCLSKQYTAYIVTGVVPSERKNINRVNVPSHFWSAYCCLDHNKKCKISRGFIGKNKSKSVSLDITVKDLEERLKSHYKVKFFKLFTTEAN